MAEICDVIFDDEWLYQSFSGQTKWNKYINDKGHLPSKHLSNQQYQFKARCNVLLYYFLSLEGSECQNSVA